MEEHIREKGIEFDIVQEKITKHLSSDVSLVGHDAVLGKNTYKNMN